MFAKGAGAALGNDGSHATESQRFPIVRYWQAAQVGGVSTRHAGPQHAVRVSRRHLAPGVSMVELLRGREGYAEKSVTPVRQMPAGWRQAKRAPCQRLRAPFSQVAA